MNNKPSTSKTVKCGDVDYEDQLLQWFDETESVVSDVSDQNLDEDFAIQSSHETESQESFSEEDEQEDISEVSKTVRDVHAETQVKEKDCYKGRNKYVWSKQEHPRTSRQLAHNILKIHLPQLLHPVKQLGKTPTPVQIWDLLFSQEILDEVVKWTNVKLQSYRSKFAHPNRPELRDIDVTELKAFLGLLLYTQIFKSSHEDLNSLFAKDGTGRNIFRVTMSAYRFSTILLCLRFDDPQTREERKKKNAEAAISDIFDLFIQNCQKLYSVGENVCVDEMLVAFRGRCKFKMYMPNKPNKYGLKIMCLTDARNNYLLNAYIYSGKGSDGTTLSDSEKKLAVPSQAVIRLVKPIEGSNRNVTGDNWFSSIELINELKKRGLTYVGTLRKSKREVPNEFLPNPRREVNSCLYGFTNTITLLSFVPKKRRAVLLVSSMHHSAFSDPNTGKPEIIEYYNNTKGGVDSLDQKCSNYSASRRTTRWPMAIFFAMVNICSTNAFVVYSSSESPVINNRFRFIKNLAYDLVLPHVQTRYNNPYLQKELKTLIKSFLNIEEQPQNINLKLQKRERCYICPYAKDRKTSNACVGCKKPVCGGCSYNICKNCI